jgi:hypothetical protein
MLHLGFAILAFLFIKFLNKSGEIFWNQIELKLQLRNNQLHT